MLTASETSLHLCCIMQPNHGKDISSSQFSQFSHSLMQHSRPPCPLPTPGVYSNSCPLSWWFHPTITSSVIPFSSCLQSFPASGSFQMSQFLTSGGQSTGVSASTSVLPMDIQDWFPLGWTGWISLLSKGLPKSLLQCHSPKALILMYSSSQVPPNHTEGRNYTEYIYFLVEILRAILEFCI